MPDTQCCRKFNLPQTRNLSLVSWPDSVQKKMQEPIFLIDLSWDAAKLFRRVGDFIIIA
jgi:hypothetical protein